MFAVAIDGPSGVGKSSVSKEVARQLGFVHVDTGALYRTIAFYMLEQGITPRAQEQVEKALSEITVSAQPGETEQQMLLNGKNVTAEIRTQKVSELASQFSQLPVVRQFLLQMQRDMAAAGKIIMDGRDIGTVVLPDAPVKIFLTAAPEERARRRYEELLGRGQQADYDTILEEVILRDHRDTSRAVSPLKQAEDAVVVDSTKNVKSQTVEIIKKIILDKMGNNA